MKKIREEIVEYWHDEEKGGVIVKTETRFLVCVDDEGEEVWKTQNTTVPLI
jgi:hypothetical protein